MSRCRPTWIGAALAALLCPLEASAEPPDAVRLNEEGLALLAEGAAQEAVERFGAALELRPREKVLQRNLAAALAEVSELRRAGGGPAEAVELLNEAVRLHPERLRYRVLRGRARFEAGRGTDAVFAREDFAWVLARDPDNLDALVNLGQVSYLERRLEEAAHLWRHALTLRPGDEDIRARLERAERELGVEASYERLVARHFLVRFSPSVPRALAESVLAICETAYGELTVRFQHWPETRTVVTIYTPEEFRAATRLHAWVAGLSDGTIRLSARPEARPDDLRATVYHEYAHHVIRGIVAELSPWLQEGLAQLAEERSVPAAEARLRRPGPIRVEDLSTRVLRHSDPRLVERFYDLALCFTRYLEERGGGRGIPELLRHLAEGRSEDEALERAFGAGLRELFDEWLRRLRPP